MTAREKPAATLPVPTPDGVKANVIHLARELGFNECRIAPAQEARHGDRFRKWLDDGCHGEMAWLEKGVERRTDPREVLEGARSVIVLGMNYFQGSAPKRVGRRGRIARYAWGSDYHDLIQDKLKDLAAYLEDIGEAHRYYVDTGPVLERDFAAESGLGWNGKSTLQIHPKLGTWFLLAVILTTADLPPDQRSNDHCGKCTRCLSACPTNAITEPHRVDARRCLSYLTIEHRGSIPEEFREAMGDRIFGCDDCLTACPWNRFAVESREATFQARDFISWDLREFLALDDDGFRELFAKSPIKRTRRQGFLRNVCVALGNVGTAADLPALRKTLQDPDAVIMEHAEWAIARIEKRHSLGGEFREQAAVSCAREDEKEKAEACSEK